MALEDRSSFPVHVLLTSHGTTGSLTSLIPFVSQVDPLPAGRVSVVGLQPSLE